MKSKRRQRDAFTEINITPLTDIFLVLLIIMMVIAPMLDQKGLSLALPSSHEAQKEEKEFKIITVGISDNNSYEIDGRPVASDNLIQAIREQYRDKKDGLLIKAAQNSTHDAVVKVMDTAQSVGIASISVVANKD